MNNITIDLHGLTEIEATGVIMTSLIELEENNVEYIEFITGRGGILTMVLEELVEESDFDYEINPYNKGSYRVF